jgi:hypothetical protein
MNIPTFFFSTSGDLLQSLTSEAELPTTSSVDLNTEDLD